MGAAQRGRRGVIHGFAPNIDAAFFLARRARGFSCSRRPGSSRAWTRRCTSDTRAPSPTLIWTCRSKCARDLVRARRADHVGRVDDVARSGALPDRAPRRSHGGANHRALLRVAVASRRARATHRSKGEPIMATPPFKRRKRGSPAFFGGQSVAECCGTADSPSARSSGASRKRPVLARLPMCSASESRMPSAASSAPKHRARRRAAPPRAWSTRSAGKWVTRNPRSFEVSSNGLRAYRRSCTGGVSAFPTTRVERVREASTAFRRFAPDEVRKQQERRWACVYDGGPGERTTQPSQKACAIVLLSPSLQGKACAMVHIALEASA